VNKAARDLSIEQNDAPSRHNAADLDAKLVSRCKRGDNAAFAELIDRYQRKVYSIALGMVKNQEDAMDITQDSFVKVHKYLGNFQGTSSFYTWLYRIVFNLCIDHIRRSGKRPNTEFDERVGNNQDKDDISHFMSNRNDLNPSKVIGRKELAERINGAISELPPYHQAVIVMREIEGLSYTEMAKIMQVSKGTIMSRLHHARQKLRRMLEPYIDGDFTLKE
jgi:RNA polymerase sigma-70 factor (ECF subfamily)